MAHLRNRNSSFIFRKIFGELEGNALDCAALEPLWAVAGGMIFFYQPLYMKSLGVTEVQMGFLNSLLSVFTVITSFIAGPITDRMGRKRASLVFDIVSWSAAMAVWAISQNFWYFLAAAVLNSFVKIPYTSWTCLSIEDTPEDKRVQFFSLIMIMNLGSGIFTPLSGLLMNRHGVVSTMRLLYMFGFITMTVMFVARNMMVEETKIGRELMRLHSRISFKEKCRDYAGAIKYMFTKPLTLTILFIMMLTSFQLSFQFFNVVYLKDTLKFSTSMTSLYPGISAVVNLFIYFVILPGLMHKRTSRNLVLGLILLTAGSALFLLIKPGTYFLLFISIVLSAAGNMLMNTFRDTLWNNSIGESERAKIFSACQGIISIIAIPSGIIAGYLYKLKPIYPFVVTTIIFSVTLLFALRAMRLENASTSS